MYRLYGIDIAEQPSRYNHVLLNGPLSIDTFYFEAALGARAIDIKALLL